VFLHASESANKVDAKCREVMGMDRYALKHLAAWNQSMAEALDLLSKLAEYTELSNEEFTIKQAYFKEQIASVNVCVLQVLERRNRRFFLALLKSVEPMRRRLAIRTTAISTCSVGRRNGETWGFRH
jgi:hypothetical protein